MKKILLIPLTLLLCSFAPRMGTYGTVGITMYSYTEYTSSSSTSYGLGHSFILLENNRSRSLDLGFYNLPPFEKCTLGLWGNDGEYDTPLDSDLEVSEDGIFYNREAYVFTHVYVDPTDMVKLYREVPVGDFLSRISNFRNSEKTYLEYNAEQYALLGYNCSNFAADFFAISTQMNFLGIASPDTLCSAIRNAGGEEAIASDDIFETNLYWRYTNDGNGYTYPN